MVTISVSFGKKYFPWLKFWNVVAFTITLLSKVSSDRKYCIRLAINPGIICPFILHETDFHFPTMSFFFLGTEVVNPRITIQMNIKRITDFFMAGNLKGWY
jgi:hypothetical protein